MTTHLDGREEMLASLTRELLGPAPIGNALDTANPPAFATLKDSYGPWVDAESGEEILQRDKPGKRYGVGVLYPLAQAADDAATSSGQTDAEQTQEAAGATEGDVTTGDIAEGIATSELKTGGRDMDADDFDLTAANQFRPSAMALSLLVELRPETTLVLRGSAGRYRPFEVVIETAARTWWKRTPVEFEAHFSATSLLAVAAPTKVPPSFLHFEGAEGLALAVEALARPADRGHCLVTVALINRSDGGPLADARSLFQTRFSVGVDDATGPIAAILPYPDRQAERLLDHDEEARSIALLYRSAPTFGVGHGCAASWSSESPERGHTVSAEPLPSYEAPSITPDVSLTDGTVIDVPMGPLAGLDPADDGRGSMRQTINAYKVWVDERREEAKGLRGHEDAAQAHLAACSEALRRMQAGLAWLDANPDARRAFMLANRAVLFQQLRAQPNPRETHLLQDGKFEVAPAQPVPDWRRATTRGRWRAFQIGFLLSAVESAAKREHPDRETVELIFFPTGGGKTEAYQGLAAFCLFYDRLTGRGGGVGVLMRYTLRLLTAQQFVRAAALICAMERIRLEEEIAGPEFSIGIWVGEATTPTRRADATRQLARLGRNPKDETNPFLLLRCPWCAAQMGPVGVKGRPPRQVPPVAGYAPLGGTVVFKCPDRSCDFRKKLPVYVIDEDIYDQRPSIVIGTVDKFAMLTWRPQARRLFGIDPFGERAADPPNLIIQDELHLIAGPLGSVIGLYEGVIEELCTDRRGGAASRPKIIASTATIRRYKQQIKGLYNRDNAVLFPPHGLDASDSFFARYARNAETGQLLPGRRYVGVHAPGLGSMQTAQVRTFAALLQGSADLPKEQRDPWWSLLIFFNSLRELGTSVSLLQSDIPDYLLAMKNRRGSDPKSIRRLRHLMELTSRLRQDEIPQAIDSLERSSDEAYPVDTCLASNIIEVGIDIPRMSMMCVVGQPKSTSQYIQVTGRVGRRWEERPGLVVMIYGASKPRDRSHFEKFRTYHERLYAQVEPVSVTPFAQPVLKRALHAALVTYVRQLGAETLAPWPVPEALLAEAGNLLTRRAEDVDPDEVAGFKARLDQRLAEWRAWERNRWEASLQDENSAPLLRRAGQWTPTLIERVSWSTPMSMRDVDAECRAEVSTLYATTQASAEGTDG